MTVHGDVIIGGANVAGLPPLRVIRIEISTSSPERFAI
jgi:hypothetical protein